MADVSIEIKAIPVGSTTASTTTILSVNPEATDEQLRLLGAYLNDLTKSEFLSVTKITKEELTTSG